MQLKGKLRGGRAKQRGGQTLVETALVLATVLLPITLGMLQYGIYLNAANTLTQLAREGGRFAALHGTETTVESQTEDYIQSAAVGTTINPADLTDTNITVTSYPTTATRVSGNAIRCTITYPMAKKIFLGNFIKNLPIASLRNDYVAEATFVIE